MVYMEMDRQKFLNTTNYINLECYEPCTHLHKNRGISGNIEC